MHLGLWEEIGTFGVNLKARAYYVYIYIFQSKISLLIEAASLNKCLDISLYAIIKGEVSFAQCTAGKIKPITLIHLGIGLPMRPL